MTLLRISLLCFIVALCLGCAKQPEVIYKTEYVEVSVPVVYKLDRPKRPSYTKTDTAPTYLLKLIEYTKVLEAIVDGHNSGEHYVR